jgi:hypothetical protein
MHKPLSLAYNADPLLVKGKGETRTMEEEPWTKEKCQDLNRPVGESCATQQSSEPHE